MDENRESISNRMRALIAAALLGGGLLGAMLTAWIIQTWPNLLSATAGWSF